MPLPPPRAAPPAARLLPRPRRVTEGVARLEAARPTPPLLLLLLLPLLPLLLSPRAALPPSSSELLSSSSVPSTLLLLRRWRVSSSTSLGPQYRVTRTGVPARPPTTRKLQQAGARAAAAAAAAVAPAALLPVGGLLCARAASACIQSTLPSLCATRYSCTSLGALRECASSSSSSSSKCSALRAASPLVESSAPAALMTSWRIQTTSP